MYKRQALVRVASDMPSARALLVTCCTQAARTASLVRPMHAGLWGIARAIRLEAPLLGVSCIDVGRGRRVRTVGLGSPEAEVAQHGRDVLVPRLRSAPPSVSGLAELHMHSRGALGDLSVRPQAPFAAGLAPFEAEVGVRAVSYTHLTLPTNRCV